ARALQKSDGARLFHQRAGQGRNQGQGGLGVSLCVCRVAMSEDVAGELQQSVLETAARSQEGPAGLPREPDRRQCALRVGVRTGGHAPKASKCSELRNHVPAERRGVDPDWLQIPATVVGRKPERLRNCPMGGHRWVKVTDQTNPRNYQGLSLLLFACPV